MKRMLRALAVLLVAALLLSVVQPVLAQDAAVPFAQTARDDAPAYGVRGPYAVGVRDFIIEPEEEGGRAIPVSVWYPALNPDGLPEEVTYELDFEDPNYPNFPVAGRALRDADPDLSGGPYPLVVYSHGYWLFRQVSAFLMEQLASHGFVVIAGDHTDNWSTIFGDNQVEDYVIRPQEVNRQIDFAEALSAPDGEFSGLIDIEHVGVTGHSFGADTTLLAGGGRLNPDGFLNEWCVMYPGDPDDWANDCVAMPDKLDQMVAMAGLDAVPEGVWPDLGDPRVDAIAPLAPGAMYFGTDGLAAVRVPIMLFESELDWAQSVASAYYEPYSALPSGLKTQVVFDRGDHGVFLNECKAMPGLIGMGFSWFCQDAVWDMNRAHDLINHFVTAFMLAELKGDADAAAALAPEAVSFPGISYQSEGYGAPVEVAAEDVPLTKRAAIASVNDINLYYETMGEGEPLLLLMGGTGCTDAWGDRRELLARKYMVIAPDNRAQGRSTDSGEPLTYQLMADDMVALLDRLGVESSHVVGVSDGGVVGLDMAIRYPERVRSLVATGAQFRADGMIPEELEWAKEMTVDSWPKEWLDFCYRSIAPEPEQLPAMIEQIRNLWLTEEYVPYEGLTKIDVPVLILEGTEPDFLTNEHVQELAAAIPGAELHWIEGAGHMASAEKPNEWAAGVLDFVAAAESARTALDPALVAEIEAFVEQEMAARQIPGAALGIVKDGEIAYAKGFGEAEYGSGRAVTPQTQFQLASLSKQFTAAAVMQLVEQGLIDLDAPVTDYLPYFKLADGRYTDLAIRHLMSNTSGMGSPDYITKYGYSPSLEAGQDVLEEYVRSLADRSLEADPEDNYFIYSNDNWDILGDVIAKVSGQPYEEYVAEHIFVPLDMSMSTFFADDLDPELATAYHWLDEDGEIQFEAISPTYFQPHTPSQGLISNTDDMLKWAQFNLNLGRIDGEQIVPAEAYDAMWTPTTEINWGMGGLFQDWGLGWALADEQGHPVMWWGGLAIGTTSNLLLAPDDDLGLFFAVNGSADYSENPPWHGPDISYAVLQKLLGTESTVEQPALDPELIAEIEAGVQEAMAAGKIPGTAFGIVQDGELAYANGFGFADREAQTPMTTQTLFQIASVSKTFVAAAILQLAEQGLVDLDAPVTEYLPYFTLREPESRNITVRQLLMHTAGMPDIENWVAEVQDFGAQTDDKALEDYVRSLSEWSLAQQPGEGFLYSSVGYDVLGDVVAKASGQSFEEYMHENLLEPLGMDSSSFIFGEAEADLLATPYTYDEDGEVVATGYYPYVRRHGPSTSLWTNVEDLSRYAMALLHGELDGKQVMPASAIEQMWTPYNETGWPDLFGPGGTHYGLGWELGEIEGHLIPNHTGGMDDGYQAHLLLIPDQETAVIAMINVFKRAEWRFRALEMADEAAGVLVAVEPQQAVEQPTLDPDLIAQIDAYVKEMMAGNGLPGFSLGIVKDGALAYAHGYGLADVDSGDPVTPQTIFQVAEVTFAPTALAVLKLANEGKLDLDAPVTDYLPYFTMQGEGAGRITARHLLMHTSGVPDSGDTAADWSTMAIETDDGALERFVRGLADTDLLYAPGEGYEWSDIGYDILGDVVAKVTGQPFEQYMQENILQPLGMAHSTFLRDEADAALLARPHIDEMGAVKVAEVVPYSRQFAAANNLHASAEDMTQFMIAVMNLGEVDGAQAVPADAFEQMWAEPIESNLGGFFMGNLYPTDMFPVTGMGWIMAEIDGHPVIHAYGGERGFQSDMMLCPDEGIGVIVMGNGQAGGDFFAPTTAVDVMGMLLHE